MSDLKKAVVKLAHEKPELRAHLLPLLKKAGKEAAGMDPKIKKVKDDLGLSDKEFNKHLNDFIRDLKIKKRQQR